MLKIVLAATDIELDQAWKNHCGIFDCVDFHLGSILDIQCDAVVSPANSFGFMGGGIDGVYSHHFGSHVQERLQRLIKERHNGELLVGCAEIVETRDESIPFLISAPTMRTPQSLRNSVNPYLAMRAALYLVRDGQFNGTPASELIQTLGVPGLGTGVGQVHPDVCAEQVAFAIGEVMYGHAPLPDSAYSAKKTHNDFM